MREVTDYLVERRVDTKIAALVAVLHATFVGLLVALIVSGRAPVPAVYWLIGFYVDVPVALLWAICLPLSLLVERHRHTGPGAAARGSSLVETLRRIPVYCWVPIGILFVAVALQIASTLGVKLDVVGDALFMGPFVMTGVLGTFLCADLARRVTRMLLPPAREPSRLHPIT
jgi:hypothetical protein